MPAPDVAVIVTTYERPENLQRVLASIARQDCPCQFEVVVADDGSRDHTAEIVTSFAGKVDFSVGFTTHTHNGFRLARCRNEGVAATAAEYLIFLDGDCVVERDYVARHWQLRCPGTALVGYCCRLTQEQTHALTMHDVQNGILGGLATRGERRNLAALDRTAWYYRVTRHRTKPRLTGGNLSLFRRDFVRVNGYDEHFVGWGCEDDDLGLRLRKANVELVSVARAIPTYHLWHPPAPSFPAKWRAGRNVEYFSRPVRLTRCMNGLVKRKLADLEIYGTAPTSLLEAFPLGNFRVTKRRQQTGDVEVELLLYSADGSFTGRADCRVLALVDSAMPPARTIRQADIILADRCDASHRLPNCWPLDQLQQALEAVIVAGHAPRAEKVA